MTQLVLFTARPVRQANMVTSMLTQLLTVTAKTVQMVSMQMLLEAHLALHAL